MNSKTNDILNDIIHTASQAILAEDEAIKRQALGDISCAIASLVPTEHAGVPAAESSGSTVYRTPKHIVDFIYETCNVPFADQADPAFLKKIAEKFKLVERSSELKGIEKFLTVHEGVKLVRFHGKNEIKLVARRKGVSGMPNAIFEIIVDKHCKVAHVKKDNTVLFTIYGMNLGYSHVEKMAVAALHRYLKNQRPNRNQRRRAAKLRAGILTPAAELAETVARQKEMDEPTTVGCPALRMMKHLPSGFDGVEPSSDDLENA